MTYKRVEHDGKIYYGQQLIVDAQQCGPKLRDLGVVADFLAALPGKIGMRAFGKPIVERFGDGDEVGISGVQLLYTSAVVLHTNDKFLDLYLDVFSCRNFDNQIVLSAIESAFQPGKIAHKTLYRE